jgi:hypothetical protein
MSKAKATRVWVTEPTRKHAFYVVWCSEHKDVSAVAALPGRMRESRAVAYRYAREHRTEDRQAAAIARDMERSTRAIKQWAREHGPFVRDEVIAQMRAKKRGR